jgi:hypothetical protein
LGIQAYSQSPTLKFFTKKSKTEITNSSHTIYGDAARFVVSEEFYSVMSGMDSVLYGAKRIELDTLTGTAEYYCWKECYIPKDAGTLPLWIATDSLMLYNNDTVAKFSSYLNPKGKLGMASYRYIFTPKGFPNDTVYVDITFDIVTVGLDVQNQSNIQIFPNPTSDFLRVNLGEIDSKDASLRMINASGQVMKLQRLLGNDVIDLNGHKPGLYIAEIRKGETTIARQKIILE